MERGGILLTKAEKQAWKAGQNRSKAHRTRYADLVKRYKFIHDISDTGTIPPAAIDKIITKLNSDPTLEQSVNDQYDEIFGKNAIFMSEGMEREKEEEEEEEVKPYKIFMTVQIYGHGGIQTDSGWPQRFVNPHPHTTKINLFSLTPQKVCSLINIPLTRAFATEAINEGAMFSEDLTKVRKLLNLADQGNETVHADMLREDAVKFPGLDTRQLAKKREEADAAVPDPKKFKDSMYCMAYDIGTQANPAMMKFYEKPQIHDKSEARARAPEIDHVHWLTVRILSFKIVNFIGLELYTLSHTQETRGLLTGAFAGNRDHTFLDIYEWANAKMFEILEMVKKQRGDRLKMMLAITDVTRENVSCTINFMDMLCNYVPPELSDGFPLHGVTKFALTVKDIDRILSKPKKDQELWKKNTLRNFKGTGKGKRKGKSRRKLRKTKRK